MGIGVLRGRIGPVNGGRGVSTGVGVKMTRGGANWPANGVATAIGATGGEFTHSVR